MMMLRIFAQLLVGILTFRRFCVMKSFPCSPTTLLASIESIELLTTGPKSPTLTKPECKAQHLESASTRPGGIVM